MCVFEIVHQCDIDDEKNRDETDEGQVIYKSIASKKFAAQYCSERFCDFATFAGRSNWCFYWCRHFFNVLRIVRYSKCVHFLTYQATGCSLLPWAFSKKNYSFVATLSFALRALVFSCISCSAGMIGLLFSGANGLSRFPKKSFSGSPSKFPVFM